MSGSFEAQLPPERESVVAARRLVEAAAATWGVDAVPAAEAALATSELVTNAVLHAGTTITVVVRRLGAGMRIEVVDGSNRLPVVEAERPEELLATRSMTGRGLMVVAATADRWGADPVADGGKSIWVEIGTGRRHVAASPAPAFAAGITPAPLSAAAAAKGVTSLMTVAAEGHRVHLVGVPVDLMVESIRQLVDFQRELQVIGLDSQHSPELAELADSGRELAEQMIRLREATSGLEDIELAMARGDAVIDVDMVLPDGVEALFDRLAAVMGQAWGSRPDLQLLTPPPSDEVVAYGRWYREEVMAQLAGAPPRPCPFEPAS